MEHQTFIGSANDRALHLSRAQRFEHMAVIGATGVGKSTLLRHIAEQDIARGDGLLYIDPHGEDAEALLDRIPPWRHNHVAYLDLGTLDHAIGLNVVETTHPDDRARAADALVAALRDIWSSSWGPRLETIFRHAALALIEAPRTSLVLLPRFLTDDAFRAAILHQVRDPMTRQFFGQRFEAWRDAYRSEAIEPLLNKVDAFLSFGAIRNVLGQATSSLHLEHAMEHGRIVICNLAKGTVGDTGAHLMGALLIARARTAAMARIRQRPEERRPFHIIADELQNLVSDSAPSVLAEVRKFSVSFTGATQFLAALPETTRAALLGTVGTLAVFRCGPDDGDVLAARFDRLHQRFNAAALQDLDRGEAIVRVGGGDPCRLRVPFPSDPLGSGPIVRRQSQRHYGRPRAAVEAKISRALGLSS